MDSSHRKHGYHGTTVETFACCAYFTGERLPVTSSHLRFDHAGAQHNRYRGIVYTYSFRHAVSDALNDAFEYE